MPTTSRPYGSEEDYALILDMLRETVSAGGPVYYTVGDLDYWRAIDDDPDAMRTAHLWLNEGDRVIGVAWPDELVEEADIWSHPAHREVEADILTWLEERRSRHSEGDEPATLTVFCLESDAWRKSLLQRRGYERGEMYFDFRVRRLDAPVPAPALPPGYSIRELAGEADLEARVAAHLDAFGASHMTAGKHRRITQSPTYRPDLDLLAIAPDGTIAAFCTLWLDEPNRLGIFEPIGCRSEHRQRGLGRALACEGMRRLQELGARTAHVSNVAGLAPASEFYDSVGLLVEDRLYQWKIDL